MVKTILLIAEILSKNGADPYAQMASKALGQIIREKAALAAGEWPYSSRV